jgi:Mor family transcriptional regulator
MNTPLNSAALPKLMEDISRLIGPELAMELARRHGGTRLYIPLPSTLDAGNPGHWLVDCVGYPAALALAEAYGGREHFDLPKCEAALRLARDAAILEERRHEPVKTVALRHGVTERTVFRISAAGTRGGE